MNSVGLYVRQYSFVDLSKSAKTVKFYPLKVRLFTMLNMFVLGFFGIIFEEDRDTAYSVQRCWQSLGFTISFICSLFFNVLWLLVPLYVVTMVMFIIAEWRYSDEMKKTLTRWCSDCQAEK